MPKQNVFAFKVGKKKQVHLTYTPKNNKMVFSGEPQHNVSDLIETLQNMIKVIQSGDYKVVDESGVKPKNITLDLS